MGANEAEWTRSKVAKAAPTNVEPALATSAHLNKTDPDPRADKSEPRDDWKRQMQQILANHKQGQEQGEQQIKQYRQEHAQGRHGAEVVVAFLQRVPQIVQRDRSDSNLA